MSNYPYYDSKYHTRSGIYPNNHWKTLYLSIDIRHLLRTAVAKSTTFYPNCVGAQPEASMGFVSITTQLR